MLNPHSSKKYSPPTANFNHPKKKKKKIKKQSPNRSPLLDLKNSAFSRNNSTTSSISSSMSIEAPKGCLRFFNKPKSAPRSKENQKQQKEKELSFNHLTPVGKLVCGFGINCVVDDSNLVSSSKSKTPPVEASISPEIQFGCSSIKVETLTTPNNSTCYGAGHVVSGVSDRRKCRPRGILTVDSSAAAVDDSDSSSVSTRRKSFIPLPAEASVNWLLSPCKENDEDHTSTSNASRFRKSVDLTSSPSSIYNSGKCSSSTGKFSISNKKTTRITLLSPKTPPEFQGLAGLSFEEVVGRLSSSVSPNEVTPNREDSSVSIDCLGSGNVIQTPKSNDSSAEKRWDPLGLSFRFANLNRISWNNSSESSQTRISWREGLASRLDEMDELDCCCRCLSDNEVQENENAGCLGKFDDEDDEKKITLSDERLSRSAESLCMDADSLVASGDSDWTLCYKNKLFQL